VIRLKPLREFWTRHPGAKTPLRHWYKLAIHARWRILAELRADLPSADGATNHRGETSTVFHIADNKSRLIARIWQRLSAYQRPCRAHPRRHNYDYPSNRGSR